MVIFEVFIIDYGKYLVDVNLRIGGDIMYLLLVCYMVLDIGLKYLVIFCYNKYRIIVKKFVEKVNVINNKGKGVIIVLFVVDMDEECGFYLFVFVKILEEV